MRTKRVHKFRKYRHKKTGRIIFFTVILPFTSILAGYLITSVFILPSMAK